MRSTDFSIEINFKKDISNKIIKLQKEIIKKYGIGKYSPDRPHITLYVNSTDHQNKIKDILNKILKKYNKFSIKFDGIHAFINDPIFLSTTLVYKIKKTKILSKIQKEIFDNISPLRNNNLETWLFKMNPNMPKKNKEMIRKYGYPYGPEDWIFHTSIISLPNGIKKNEFKKLFNNISKSYNIKTSIRINNIILHTKTKTKSGKLKTKTIYKLK